MTQNGVENNARIILNRVLLKQQTKLLCKQMQEYSPCLYEHCSNVAYIATQISLHYPFTEKQREEIATGAILHDLGKIFLPKEILEKPEKLTEQEFKDVKEHPVLGAKLLTEFGYSDMVVDIVRHHHENQLQTGYPDKIELLSSPVKIVACADKYEATNEVRPYRKKENQLEAQQSAEREIVDALGAENILGLIHFITRCNTKEGLELWQQ